MPLIPARIKKIQSKMKSLLVATTFIPFKDYENFSRRSRAGNSAARYRIGPNFEPILNFMIVLLTRENEEDPIKNEDARVATRLYVDFSNAQGQITP